MWGWLRSFGSLIGRAMNVVKDTVPEATLASAVRLVKEAAVRYTDNTERREWVVTRMLQAGVSESIARLAVELAVRLLKEKLA